MGMTALSDPRTSWQSGPRVFSFSAGAIALSSLGGALVFPISDLGRTSPASISRAWALELVLFWLALAVWAFLYWMLLRRVQGVSTEKALRLSAISQTPLLLCIGLVAAVYFSDQVNHAYLIGPYRAVFQDLAKAYVVVGPALAQLAVLAALRWRSFVDAIPILGVGVLALALRVWSLGWSLPALLHIDEHKYIGRALSMLGSGDPNPHYFENPNLLIYLDYALVRLVSPHVQTFHAAAEWLGSRFPDPRGDLVMDVAARGLSASAGALTVVAVYFAAKELFGRGAGIIGGLLIAVSYLHVRNSHFATNDVIAALLMTCAFLCAVRLYHSGAGRYYLLAGLLGGLAASAKYNVGVFAVSVLVAHLLRMRVSGESGVRRPSHLLLALAAVVSLAGFVAGTPYSVLDFPSFVEGFQLQYNYGALPWRGQENPGSSLLMYAATLVYGFGAIPLTLSIVGTALAARRLPARLLLVLSIPATYLLFMSTQQLFFVRFAIPLLPFLAVLAGYGAIELGRMVPPTAYRRAVTVAVVAVAAVQPIVLSLQQDALMSRADTRALAAAWIDANIPGEARIAIEGYSQMDGRYGWPTGNIRSTWTFRAGNEDDLKELLSGEFNYLLVSSFGYGTWFDTGRTGALQPDWYRRVTQGATLLATFSPGPGDELPYNLDDTYAPFWNLGDRERPGPTVRVYRLGDVRK